MHDICEAVLSAKDAGVLKTEQERRYAIACESLIRSFAKVGIVALVDEATGYQREREKDALAKLLAVYLSEERLKWAKMFPDEFYKQVYRLNKWNWPPANKSKRTPLIGKYTNEVVYERLPSGVLDKLKELNPIHEKTGRRKWKHTQFLSEDLGQPDLKNHILQVIALMKAATTWKAFLTLVDRVFPKQGQQLHLDDI
ncbi:phage protein [Desulfovibrio sp. A2]|nr:phage protein [Desulfovibrio sp. A2]